MNDTDTFPWWRKDASILAALLAMAAISFLITFIFTRSYQRREQALAERWFQRGEASLRRGKPQEAIIDLRTAMLYEPDGPQFRLRLAQALAANNDTPQAIAYFLNLWEGQPGKGLYNLELARLYARSGDTRRATQFYNSAIYGAWDEDPAEQRRRARLEYITFLLANNSRTQAQAEAITLAAAVQPTDIPARFLAADILIKTGEFERAFNSYTSLLRNDQTRASVGAAQAAFQLGRFRSAATYLQQAVAKDNRNPSLARQLQQAKLVLEMDPVQHRLTAAERARRVLSAYETAGNRLQQCAAIKNQALLATPPTTDMQRLYDEWAALGPEPSSRSLAADPEQRDQIMNLAGRIEEVTNRVCGTPSGEDWAVLMLSRFGEGVER
jgi:tetratricopeptide (TPR) repeat protein